MHVEENEKKFMRLDIFFYNFYSCVLKENSTVMGDLRLLST